MVFSPPNDPNLLLIYTLPDESRYPGLPSSPSSDFDPLSHRSLFAKLSGAIDLSTGHRLRLPSSKSSFDDNTDQLASTEV
ncbi:unnamed protein product [Protopolystoma xenopodis]|uniref:Uncharacterized protein n=1 Tax=Protopolystoma xenopodis TaxID=117903 RepID=A0A448WVA1_9PLAT|nr:unnamed protein product [Protopolystoma xenopodis]